MKDTVALGQPTFGDEEIAAVQAVLKSGWVAGQGPVGQEFEKRFANRAGEVSKMPGFEEFQLLRPSDGRDICLVYTRWASEEAFNDWVNSAAFQHGHKQHSSQGPVGTASELWSFDVIQQETV